MTIAKCARDISSMTESINEDNMPFGSQPSKETPLMRNDALARGVKRSEIYKMCGMEQIISNMCSSGNERTPLTQRFISIKEAISTEITTLNSNITDLSTQRTTLKQQLRKLDRNTPVYNNLSNMLNNNLQQSNTLNREIYDLTIDKANYAELAEKVDLVMSSSRAETYIGEFYNPDFHIKQVGFLSNQEYNLEAIRNACTFQREAYGVSVVTQETTPHIIIAAIPIATPVISENSNNLVKVTIIESNTQHNSRNFV